MKNSVAAAGIDREEKIRFMHNLCAAVCTAVTEGEDAR